MSPPPNGKTYPSASLPTQPSPAQPPTEARILGPIFWNGSGGSSFTSSVATTPWSNGSVGEHMALSALVTRSWESSRAQGRGSHQGLTCPILGGPFHTKHCTRAGGSSRSRKEANGSPVSLCPPRCPVLPAAGAQESPPRPACRPQKTGGHGRAHLHQDTACARRARAQPGGGTFCPACFWIASRHSRGQGRRKKRKRPVGEKEAMRTSQRD